MEKENKRSIKRILLNTLIILVIIAVGVFLYAKYVGTKKLVVKEYKLESTKIPESFSGDKIVYFSDLLYGSTIFKSDLELIVEEINKYKPDIVIYGGDLLSPGYKIKDEESKGIQTILSKIDANLGKYASFGSKDGESSIKILENSGFEIAQNKDYLVYDRSNNPICISIIDSYLKGKYNLEEPMKCEGYNIVLTHESDVVDLIKKDKNPDVILSGNSVGGEIKVPFIGQLIKFKGSNKYYKSYYNVKGTKVYISNGLGTKKVFLRLFNRPSFTVFRLKSTN